MRKLKQCGSLEAARAEAKLKAEALASGRSEAAATMALEDVGLLSSTLDASFCVRTVARAMAVHGVPEIFNSDQGSQFTSAEFTQPLLAAGVKLSMNGQGRCLDNVFVERLWRSVKHEEVYLRGYDTMVDAHAPPRRLLPLL